MLHLTGWIWDFEFLIRDALGLNKRTNPAVDVPVLIVLGMFIDYLRFGRKNRGTLRLRIDSEVGRQR